MFRRKGYTLHATKDDPRYEIKSDKTDHVAFHKGAALRALQISPSDRSAFYTIGHSTRPISEFIGLLRESQIEIVADVRTVPRSRTNPQFNMDVLSKRLDECDIGYEHLVALGGLRPRSTDAPPCLNGLWQNQSFHNYADYAMSEEFRSGLTRLLHLGSNCRCAIMCAEAVWWRCHRRIIADYLLASGAKVFHILGRSHIDKAQITPGAKIEDTGVLTYPG